jgi:ABC-type bacteriocin/lantibiotic exporter with double-glycine peptidase domain
VALVGLSGGGKTTIFRVLLGLIKAENGKAYINTPLPNYEQITISPYTRKLFSYVPQGNIIFSGSIADNIRIVNQNLTDEQIIKYLKLACAYDFVEPMPDGINSIIGENGFGLSEGQSQRIAIARAIACDAPIMLFDEATSALDAHTEKVVLNNISSLDGNHICIFSTHRFSVLDICDKIYHVANNSVTELTQKQAHDYCLDI